VVGHRTHNANLEKPPPFAKREDWADFGNSRTAFGRLVFRVFSAHYSPTGHPDEITNKNTNA